MADTRPTKLGLFYKIYLCFLAIFYPKQLIEEEEKDNEQLFCYLTYSKNKFNI